MSLRIKTAPAYAQDTALGEPPAPALAYSWPGVVEWSGPGILYVVSGCMYPLDWSEDAALRRVRMGGDVCATPYAGMRLEVRDAEGRTLAAETVMPPRVFLAGVRGG